jgi:uncharacterized protein (TIGR02271 family)
MQNDRSTTIAALKDLPDFELAEGNPDVRGWEVNASDGQKVGEVADLIIDQAAERVKYLDVEVDKKVATSKGQHVLIPIGAAQLDEHDDRVILTGIGSSQLGNLPAYQNQAVTKEFETRVQQAFTTGRAPAQRSDKAGGAGEQRLTLSEEELRVGKRQVSRGEVGVRKTVETEHVTKKVPLMHEEVSIERHPVSPDTPSSDEITEGEIRIPLMAEEAVVEKRAVAKEEIVIKKQKVQGEQTVEADLRKERVDTGKSGPKQGRN